MGSFHSARRNLASRSRGGGRGQVFLIMSTLDGAAAFPLEKRGFSQAIIGRAVPECQHPDALTGAYVHESAWRHGYGK